LQRHENDGRLRRLLTELKEEYEFILIDTPPALGLLTVNGLVAADSVPVPLQCDFFALEGLRYFLRFLEILRAHLNPTLQMEGVLLTLSHNGDGLSRLAGERARLALREKVFATEIPWDQRLRESAARRRPLLLKDMTYKVSRRYLSLAREIIGRREGLKDGSRARPLNGPMDPAGDIRGTFRQYVPFLDRLGSAFS